MKPKITKQKKESGFISGEVKRLFSIVLMALLLSFTQNAQAQAPNWQWAKQMAGTSSFGHGMSINSSGYIYSTGNFWGTVDFDPGASTYNLTGTGNDDGYISKLDISGNFVWAKAFNGPGGFSGYDITSDAAGNVYSAGVFNGTSDFDPGTGTFNLTATGSQDIYISKLDNAGNFIWAKALNGTITNYNWVNSIALDPSTGDVYTTGWFHGTVDFDPGIGVYNLASIGANNIFILKLDNAGNFIWAKSIGGNMEARSLKIVVDNAGNVYSVGGFTGTVDFDPGPWIYNLAPVDSIDMYILKLNASGNFVSALVIGGVGFEFIQDIRIDNANGDIYVGGSFDGTVDFDPGAGTFNLSANGQWDSFILKLSGSGNFIWAKSVGGTNNEALSAIALDLFSANKGVYVSGSFSGTVDFDPGLNIHNLTSDGGGDTYVLKLDINSGNLIYAKRFGGTNDDIAISMSLDNDGYPYFSGYFYSSVLSFVTTTGTTTFSNSGGNANAFVAKLDTMLTTGIDDISYSNSLSVYPNPASDLLVISYPLLGGKEITTTITDITGKIIYQTSTSSKDKLEVNTSTFAHGVYLVRVQSKDFIETKKVIIAK